MWEVLEISETDCKDSSRLVWPKVRWIQSYVPKLPQTSSTGCRIQNRPWPARAGQAKMFCTPVRMCNIEADSSILVCIFFSHAALVIADCEDWKYWLISNVSMREMKLFERSSFVPPSQLTRVFRSLVLWNVYRSLGNCRKKDATDLRALKLPPREISKGSYGRHEFSSDHQGNQIHLLS